MPTDDPSAPPPRRRLGRGPGSRPLAAPPPSGEETAEPTPSGEVETAEPASAERGAVSDPPAAPGTTAPSRAHDTGGNDSAPDDAGGRDADATGPGRGSSARTEDSRGAAAPGTAASAAGAGTARPDRGASRPGNQPQEPTGLAPAEPEAADDGAADAAAVPAEGAGEAEGDGRFTVRLDNFEGPFDLLLQLISKHKLDVTEVALSKVTDEFMAYIHAMGPDWDLDQTTEFLVVAATLLDLKAARLLPSAEVEDEGDLALLEARDLLFARLLQYRAYKQIADIFSDRLTAEARRHPRTVGLEPHHAELLPEVVISIGSEGFAKLAVKAMQPRAKPQVYVDHIHAPLVSVREQAEVVVARLRNAGELSFRALTEDAPDTLTVVARFLALLELYRERAVVLDQQEALGSLMVRWTGGAEGEGPEPVVTDEFDQEPGERAGRRPRAAEKEETS